ncbi:MAG: hypothetical protein WAX77_04660, partial [Methylococcaceae bacterium]
MTRSPIFFYVRDPLYVNENGFYYVADVYVWSGDDVTDKPSVPTLRLSRYPDAIGGAAFDVSDVCNSFLDTHLVRESGALYSNGAGWVFVEFGWIDDDGEHLIEASSTNICIVKGWTGYMDGVNFNIAQLDGVNRWLTDRNNTIRIFTDCYFTLGLTYKTKDYGVYQVKIWDDNSNTYIYDIYSLIGTADNSNERVLMFQCGMDWLTDNTNLAAKVAFSSKLTPTREYYVQGTDQLGVAVTEKFTFEIVDCAPWGVYTLQFLNKYGVWDYLICEGRKKLKLQVETNEVFRNPLKIDMPGNITVDTPKGQYSQQIMAREGLVVNTGWLNEADNELVRQLLMSPRVIQGESADGKSWQPLNVKMSSYE